MVGVDWTLVGIIAAGVVGTVILIALMGRLLGGKANRAAEENPRHSAEFSLSPQPSPTHGATAASLALARSTDVDAPGVSSAFESRPVDPVLPLGAEIVLTMTCGPLGASDGFKREVRLVGGDGVYTWTLGSKESDRYERWEMKLDGEGGFSVAGEYVEGVPGLKPISFVGTIVGSAVSGEGMRGPRKSTIHN